MQLPDNVTYRKVCKKCKKTYTGEADINIAFRRKSANNCSHHRAICEFCEQTRRTEKAKQNRWKAKARNTRRSHSRRLNISIKDLEIKHGWSVNQMAHDAEFYYQNGCPECHELFSEMGNGLSDITLDIWDRDLEPGYSNTKWMCNTCNQAKGKMTPERWIRKKRLWREWIILEETKPPEPKQLTIFDDLE